MGERECHWNDLWEAALHPSEDGVRPDSSLGGDGRTGRVPAVGPAQSYRRSRCRGLKVLCCLMTSESFGCHDI